MSQTNYLRIPAHRQLSSDYFGVIFCKGIQGRQGGPDIMAMVDWVSQTNYLRIPAHRQLSSDYFGVIFRVVWKEKKNVFCWTMSFQGFILKCISDQLLLFAAGQHSSGQGNISQLVRETGISENQDTRCTCQSGNTGVNDCV